MESFVEIFKKETGYSLSIREDYFYYNGNMNLHRVFDGLLPVNLLINGSLYIDEADVNSLPDNLFVFEDLVLENSSVNSLPESLIVAGSLVLRESSIGHFPQRMIIGKDFEVAGSEIGKLPKELIIGNSFRVYKSEIVSSPSYLYVANLFYMQNSRFKEAPEEFVVGHMMDLSNAGLLYIKGKIIVGGLLNLSHNGIMSLPEDLQVISLDISDTKISSLPDSLVVRDMILVGGTNVAQSDINKINNVIPYETALKIFKARNPIMVWEQRGVKYIKMDGDIFVLECEYSTLYKVREIDSEVPIYIYNDWNGNVERGATAEEAYLKGVVSSVDIRDRSEYIGVPIDYKLTLGEAFSAYMSISGANKQEVKQYIEKNHIKACKNRYSIREMIEVFKDEESISDYCYLLKEIDLKNRIFLLAEEYGKCVGVSHLGTEEADFIVGELGERNRIVNPGNEVSYICRNKHYSNLSDAMEHFEKLIK